MNDDKTVYIETSVVSYLTARPSNDPTIAERQAATREWWNVHGPNFELRTSGLTMSEAGRGDREAAARRHAALAEITILIETAAATALANALIHNRAMPPESRDDARHVAIAAVHNVDYLLTWNQAHIDNPATRSLIRAVCERQGYRCPEIYKPSDMIGGTKVD